MLYNIGTMSLEISGVGEKTTTWIIEEDKEELFRALAAKYGYTVGEVVGPGTMVESGAAEALINPGLVGLPLTFLDSDKYWEFVDE